MMRPEFDRLLELLPVLFPREEGFTWNRHAFLQIGYEGTPSTLMCIPIIFMQRVFHLQNSMRSWTGF